MISNFSEYNGGGEVSETLNSHKGFAVFRNISKNVLDTEFIQLFLCKHALRTIGFCEDSDQLRFLSKGKDD